MKTWLASAGPYTIEKIPCPHPGVRISPKVPQGVLHTTEGFWDSAENTFKQHYAPTFQVGLDKERVRIAQLIPLGYMATALENDRGGVETNSLATAQIEVVGFSHVQPYAFDAKTTDALAHLMAALYNELSIPLTRPYGDAMPPPPWATETFRRRLSGNWGKTAGWYGHVEVPENEHWDPGALQWSKLLQKARGYVVHSEDELAKAEERLDAINAWVAVQRAAGWTWAKIKASANWGERARLRKELGKTDES